jgi:adenylate cyclase
MKYRAKLYVALAGTALITSVIGFSVLYVEFKRHTFFDEQVKAITVAATTAALIDTDLLKDIRERSDEASSAYAALKKELLKARNANRRQNIFIRYLYTLKPDPEHPEQLLFLVDAEEDPRQVSHVGDPDQNPEISEIVHHLGDYYSPGKFIVDPWGVWISGFAPVYDSQGNYVATVGADISVERYLFDLERIIKLFVIGFLLALVFALGGGYLLARRVTLSLRTILSTVREIGHGNLKAKSSLHTHDEFEELATEINTMASGLEEREQLKLNFSKYVSKHVMEQILQSPAKLAGERRKITVLFSDIRQFTHLAERLPPEQVVSLLNEYFEAMIEVIFRYHGTLDKFLGDGLMVEFGAPLDDESQEKHAVLAAIGMQKDLQVLVAKWKKEGKPKIEIGIGIHTGLAIVGNIGSEKRIEYTAIGDTVNVASRIEQATKLLKQPILISETTYQAIKEEFKTISLGPLILPGRQEAISIYAIDFEAANLS